MSTDHTHPAALELERLVADCQMRRGRRSGPGGQHRNKVETAIVITHLPSGVRAEATERRSQHQNRRVALFRLRVKLALQIRCRRAALDVPSPLWKSRCADGRIHVRATHDDFPRLLAEALDVLAGQQMDPRAAADQLGCSSSQLIKLLQAEPAALQQLNEHRRRHGQPPLR